jgi:DNA-binding NtrC family response regulator
VVTGEFGTTPKRAPSAAGSDAPQARDPSSLRILVIASAEQGCQLLAALEGAGVTVCGRCDASDAAQSVARDKPHIVLVDSELSGSGAEESLELARAHHGFGLVLLCPSPTSDVLAFADRVQADTILCMPLEPAVLRRHLMRESERAPAPRRRPDPFVLPRQVISTGSPMREVWRRALLVAQTDSSVLITGDTGSGKEVFARGIHRFSARRNAPFVAVNCAAIPETLLESELFGHERGAFTGAAAQRKGRFELAHGGTLLLDEIGDMPQQLQSKLLRALQERSFERVGGSETISVDVRVIAATHKDMAEEIARGRCRADLYYRLNVLSLRVPALRERGCDLLALWHEMIEEAAARENRAVPQTSMAVQRVLLGHDWPGNVRELQNVAQHALTVAAGAQIMPADLPDYLVPSGDRRRNAAGSLLGMTLRELERAAILETYAAVGTVREAAVMLDISPRKIHYRLSEYRREDAFPPSERRPADAAAVMPESGARATRVLLAEDDDDLRWALADLLKSEGYAVMTVPDGRVFLEQLGKAVLQGAPELPADVVITDLRMPGLSGMQILEHIREKGWQVPVVMITAYADPDARERAAELGAAFMTKPLDFEALQRVIAESMQ